MYPDNSVECYEKNPTYHQYHQKYSNTGHGEWERQEHTSSQQHLLSERTRERGIVICIGAILSSTI